MCSNTLMTIIIHVCILLLITNIYYITNVLHYFDACCKCLLCNAYAFYTLIIVLISGIRLGWLIYLAVWPNEVMSGRLVNTCSVGCNNCKYCIDTYLTFLVSSHISKALSKIFSQILKLGLYFKSKVSLGVWFLIETMSPILKSVLSGSLIGGGYLSLAVSGIILPCEQFCPSLLMIANKVSYRYI